MDRSYVKSVIEGLKSSSSARIQESLLKIRSKIITSDSGIKVFRDCNGLDHLVTHLRKPNERILDLTLSILGNCCLEEECSLAVKPVLRRCDIVACHTQIFQNIKNPEECEAAYVASLNTFGPLVAILKNVCRDSIVGRSCRLLGNLAQRNTNAEALHNFGTVTALVTLIEKRDRNTSYPTLTMAVRAIRQLWMVNEKRDDMLSLNAVRCIVILLTSECESAGIIKSSIMVKEGDGLRKSQEELIVGILKCLGHFTTHATAPCAEQLQGDGRGYQCLVALTKTYETLALKCLMNLCYMASCRPLLGIAGLVECMVGILKKISEVSNWPEGAPRALAQLSGESVNRSRLRHAGGLPLLLAAARHSAHAMHALLQYVFDDSSFQILVNEGLISFLTDELKTYLETMEFEHNNTEVTDMLTDTDMTSLLNESTDTNDTTDEASKANLFVRRRQNMATKNEDELRVVIERDNMIVGFVDAVDSDASEDSLSGDEKTPVRRKCLKRSRSRSPKTLKKLIRMASKDWSAGVYWEPKSPEWPTHAQPCGSWSAVSPDRDQSPLSPYSEGNHSPEYMGSSSKRARWDWSPSSGVSSGEGGSLSPRWTEYQGSPGSSPRGQYSGNDAGSSDSEMSVCYSPVCSSASSDAVDLATCRDLPTCRDRDPSAAQVARDLDELHCDDADDVDAAPPPDDDDATKTDPNSRSSQIACVLVLLFRVSHGASYGTAREEPVPNHTLELLTGRECLNALLDYVARCKRPLGRAARILARVLSNALCLMSILKHRLTLRLHSMSVTSEHPTTKCQQCKQIVRLSGKLLAQLTILAESSYGTGEISYQLLKGSEAVKQTLCLTLPHIVRTEKPLKKYFIDCSALNVLFKIISESKEDMHDCVVSLAKLAGNVHIKDPKLLENRYKEHIFVTYDPILDNLTADEIVTFTLDDHSTVQANKVFLCQNSDVFSAMLNGCFKESGQSCVRLKDVSKPGLEYLFTLLHLGLNNPENEVQIFPMAEKLETNLEVLLLADRFLFEKLKGLVNSAILQFGMTPRTADRIYVWSLSEGMGFLCVESVAYLLVGKMCDEERTSAFRTIFNLEYKDQWLDDIKGMILRQLGK